MTDRSTPSAKPVPEDVKHTAQIVMLQDLPGGASPSGSPIAQGNLSLVEGVKVKVEARLGSADLTVSELFGLKRDSVLALDAALDAPIELWLGDKLVARGQLVAVDDRFGLRISDIVAQPADKRV